MKAMRGSVSWIGGFVAAFAMTACHGPEEAPDASDCPAPLEVCGDGCTNTMVDSRHCGDCDTECAAGEVCNGEGACVLSCQEGLVECDGTCVDPDTDRAHCGAGPDCSTDPGNECLAGEICDGAGACALSCQEGLLDCDGTCTNTAIDPDHCSDCDTSCPDQPGSAPVCVSSVCDFVCDVGLRDCDGVASNGCESDLLTDESNCGACGVACAPGVACEDGACPMGLDFDGVDDTLASASPLALGLSSSFTAEYWIMPRSRAWMKLLNIHNADNRDVDVELRPDGLVYCTLFDQSGANHGSTSTSQLALDAWTHVACSYDGTTQRMFVNGALEASTAWTGQVALGDVVTISGFESRFVDGVIDEFRLSSSAVYTAAFTPPEHFVVGGTTLVLWNLDEGTGTTTADGSGNGFTGLLGASAAAPDWVGVNR